MNNQTFAVEQKNIYKTSLLTTQTTPLAAGEVRFKIQNYALTTNNITYAVSGFSLKYWDFFPIAAPHGIIPVWGYAEVMESQQEGIKIGERYYGYFPMSDYLTVSPQKINTFGFSDGAAHRRELAPIYNYYSRTAADPTFNEQTEAYIPIIKPLFATSFLIYHYLKKENFFDAEQILLTSASSKTGLALAFMLKQNQDTDGKKIVGLTSERNVEFVKSTGYYDEVMTYEAYQAQLSADAAAMVDFAGNAAFLKNCSDGLGSQLTNIILVGLTDWKAANPMAKIPRAKFFFAPTHIQRMYKDWGIETANLRLNKAMVRFIEDTKTMIELEIITDMTAVPKLYLEMLEGKVNPKKGILIRHKF